MASPKIETTYSSAISQISVLEKYRSSSLSLEAKFQHLVSEVIMLRLFAIIENAIHDTALKIACGKPYRNGTNPNIFSICRSMAHANLQFQSYNRPKSIQTKWTKVAYINRSIKKIIPESEPFRQNISNFCTEISEMRNVRNHIAHRTSSTYTNYKQVIISTFGAHLKIKTGAFLTSTKRLPNPKINTYLSIAKIVVNDITKG